MCFLEENVEDEHLERVLDRHQQEQKGATHHEQEELRVPVRHLDLVQAPQQLAVHLLPRILLDEELDRLRLRLLLEGRLVPPALGGLLRGWLLLLLVVVVRVVFDVAVENGVEVAAGQVVEHVVVDATD